MSWDLENVIEINCVSKNKTKRKLYEILYRDAEISQVDVRGTMVKIRLFEQERSFLN